MNPENDLEIENNYDDMEQELDRQEISEKQRKALMELANYYLSEDQLKDKGKLLGYYKSKGFLKTYVGVYERAIIGKAETNECRKPRDISWGYAFLARAVAEGSVLYLIRSTEEVYRIRHLKGAEKIAYLVNCQKSKTENGL